VTTTLTADGSAESPRRRTLTGIIPPIPTPFRDGKLDLESLRRLLEHLMPRVDGVLVGGSTGETPSLSIAEREDVLRTVATHLSGSDHTIVFSIADNSLEHSRRLSDTAGEHGADLLILSCPSYYPNSQAMLTEYLAEVGEFASGELCLYDNPYVTKTWLTAAQVNALAAAVPQLSHVKMTDTAIGKVREIVAAGDATVYAGEDSVLWHHLLEGVEGIMSAIPMFYPDVCAELWEAFASGRRDEAFERYRAIAPFITAGIHADDYIAVVKTVLAHRSVIASSEVRRPLLPLSRERLSEILEALV
jgi:4-hydroxy-tetrahydrodipicolinate synthase